MKHLIEENYSLPIIYINILLVIFSKAEYIYFSFLMDPYIYVKSKYNINRRQMRVKRK